MTVFVACVLIGVLAGWLGGLAMRTSSQFGILLDIAAGVVGALLGPLLLGSGTAFESVMASALLALIFVALWTIAKRIAEVDVR